MWTLPAEIYLVTYVSIPICFALSKSSKKDYFDKGDYHLCSTWMILLCDWLGMKLVDMFQKTNFTCVSNGKDNGESPRKYFDIY
jgi:hypothetical protein